MQLSQLISFANESLLAERQDHLPNSLVIKIFSSDYTGVSYIPTDHTFGCYKICLFFGYCVWLLRAVPQRLSEKVLEGSPSEDVIVAMEMLELDESPLVEDFDSVDSSMKASRDSFSPTDNNPTNSDDVGGLMEI